MVLIGFFNGRLVLLNPTYTAALSAGPGELYWQLFVGSHHSLHKVRSGETSLLRQVVKGVRWIGVGGV